MTFDVNDQCPACNCPSGLPQTSEPDDAFDCVGCGVRLNVCVAFWEEPARVWVETEQSRREALSAIRFAGRPK